MSFDFDAWKRFLEERLGPDFAERIYRGDDGGPVLRNGRPHNYGDASRSNHHNHVHLPDPEEA